MENTGDRGKILSCKYISCEQSKIKIATNFFTKSVIFYLVKLLIQSETDPFRHGLRRRAAQKESSGIQEMKDINW